VSVNEQAVPEAVDADQKRLHELGYAQELWRRMSGFSNFAVSFTIITILFMLPQVGPIKFATFNYAVIAVLVVIGFAGIYWLVSARHWFKGPKVQGTAEELAAIEHELTT
jgi:hypothetical protein